MISLITVKIMLFLSFDFVFWESPISLPIPKHHHPHYPHHDYVVMICIHSGANHSLIISREVLILKLSIFNAL